MKELKDRGAQGRACGNLGNTHYLLGNFELAIIFHEEVLYNTIYSYGCSKNYCAQNESINLLLSSCPAALKLFGL